MRWVQRQMCLYLHTILFIHIGPAVPLGIAQQPAPFLGFGSVFYYIVFCARGTIVKGKGLGSYFLMIARVKGLRARVWGTNEKVLGEAIPGGDATGDGGWRAGSVG